MDGVDASAKTVVFVHMTGSPFHDRVAQHAAAQAVKSGYRTLMVSDSSTVAVRGSEYIDISKYWSGAEAFSKLYEHISSNDYKYELLCFQRWYVVGELLKDIGGGAWVLDSDILVYPGMEKFVPLLEGKVLNIPHSNFFENFAAIAMVTEYFEEVYSDRDKLNALCERHMPPNGVPHLSDMIFFGELLNRHPDSTVSSGDARFRGLDSSVRTVAGFESRHGHKVVRLEAGLPYCRTLEGEDVRFYTLHFQGLSKALMSVMATIDDPETLAELTDLSYYFHLPGHEAVPDLLQVKDVYDEFLERRDGREESEAS